MKRFRAGNEGNWQYLKRNMNGWCRFDSVLYLSANQNVLIGYEITTHSVFFFLYRYFSCLIFSYTFSFFLSFLCTFSLLFFLFSTFLMFLILFLPLHLLPFFFLLSSFFSLFLLLFASLFSFIYICFIFISHLNNKKMLTFQIKSCFAIFFLMDTQLFFFFLLHLSPDIFFYYL